MNLFSIFIKNRNLLIFLSIAIACFLLFLTVVENRDALSDNVLEVTSGIIGFVFFTNWTWYVWVKYYGPESSMKQGTWFKFQKIFFSIGFVVFILIALRIIIMLI